MLEEPWLKHITSNLKVFLFTWSVISFWHTTFTHHKLLSRLFSKDTGSELWDRQWILHCVLVYSGLMWLNVCGLTIRSQSKCTYAGTTCFWALPYLWKIEKHICFLPFFVQKFIFFKHWGSHKSLKGKKVCLKLLRLSYLRHLEADNAARHISSRNTSQDHQVRHRSTKTLVLSKLKPHGKARRDNYSLSIQIQVQQFRAFPPLRQIRRTQEAVTTTTTVCDW